MPLRSMGICACATRTDAPAGARVHPHTYSGCAIILLLCLTSEIFRKCLFRTHAPLLLFRDHPSLHTSQRLRVWGMIVPSAQPKSERQRHGGAMCVDRADRRQRTPTQGGGERVISSRGKPSTQTRRSRSGSSTARHVSNCHQLSDSQAWLARSLVHSQQGWELCACQPLQPLVTPQCGGGQLARPRPRQRRRRSQCVRVRRRLVLGRPVHGCEVADREVGRVVCRPGLAAQVFVCQQAGEHLAHAPRWGGGLGQAIAFHIVGTLRCAERTDVPDLGETKPRDRAAGMQEAF